MFGFIEMKTNFFCSFVVHQVPQVTDSGLGVGCSGDESRHNPVSSLVFSVSGTHPFSHRILCNSVFTCLSCTVV